MNKFLDGEWSIPFTFLIHLLVYAIILAMIVIFVILIFKYLERIDASRTEELATSIETDRLLGANKPILPKYGTYNQEDVESGDDTKDYPDELTEGKICIICYDERRDCFFVPCGHCATCQSCANRIMEEEIRRCPICRRLIRRVKKTFRPYKSKLEWLRTKVLGNKNTEKSKSIEES